MVNSVYSPVVLVFDLDETLFEVHLTENERTNLSQSAQTKLSNSLSGKIEKPTLKVVMGKKMKALSLTALSREAMGKVFAGIHDTIKNATAQGKISPIAVKIITTSSYDEKCVKTILNQLYFNENEIIGEEKEFPIKYYNDTKLHGKFIKSSKTSQGLEDTRKLNLINKKFPQWKKEMPELEKNKVVLIDNADYNTEPVKRIGYSALHYATTTCDRLEGIFFTQQETIVFEKLNQYINDARASIGLPLLSENLNVSN